MTKNNHKYQAIISRKGGDEFKGKIMNEKYAEVVLDVYMKPEEYARFLSDFAVNSFVVEFKKE